MFGSVINEANEPSSACRLWRISQVETSAPPANFFTLTFSPRAVKPRAYFANPCTFSHTARSSDHGCSADTGVFSGSQPFTPRPMPCAPF